MKFPRETLRRHNLWRRHAFLARRFDQIKLGELPKRLAQIAFVAILSALFVIILYAVLRIVGVDAGALGTFGDFIGGSLNPIMGFLSILAILFTIVLQGRELAATRDELRASRIAQENQVQNLRQQLEIARGKERVDLTFKMLERWVAPDMEANRRKAWDYFHKKFDGGTTIASTIELSAVVKDDPVAFECLANVCQFLSDLKKLIDADKLDSELAHSLFIDSAYPWFRYIRRLDRVSNTQGSSDDSSEIEIYNRNVISWYKKVASLGEWFEARRDVG